MMATFMARGNQYIQLLKFMYCKLPAIGKKLPTFPGFEPQASEVGGKCVTTGPLLSPSYKIIY